ncbi:N5-carboxyaminoimidazole ribonucleotide mutase [mine drainage metagenome]|uniref:N5-carboxyaminoimidazole ribonucleotide mutase n=1 Tax=mine drainage metagenome TaxID=410659 RepID=A0A1J5P1A8_9ZZZZ
MNSATPLVGVLMGSDSDWDVMSEATKALTEFGIPFEVDVISAHRMPDETIAYARSAVDRGLKVIIAGAGGAAHLPGVLAALTRLPVIGVPVPLKMLDGLDSLLSIVQMPAGVPVATVGIGAAKNAGLLAVRMLAMSDAALGAKIDEFIVKQRKGALEKGASLRARRENKTGF